MVYKATRQERLVKLYKELALSINLVPWVLSYPRVGANPGNEVDSLGMKIRLLLLLLLFVNTINGQKF